MINNKYFQLFVFTIILFLSGYIYSKFYRPPEIGQARLTGETVEIEVRVLKNQWKWEPETIKVKAGDRVRLKIYNEDDYDHGFALDVFGINRRLFPRQTTLVEFIASNQGKFNFYCSVPCGEGHYGQTGIMVVE